jgi:hypothetical protein
LAGPHKEAIIATGFWKNRPRATARLTIPAQMPINVKQLEEVKVQSKVSQKLLQMTIKTFGIYLTRLEPHQQERTTPTRKESLEPQQREKNHTHLAVLEAVLERPVNFHTKKG